MLKRSRSIGDDGENVSSETKRKKADNSSDSTDLSHHDYTVGWVCALPKEQTAATAMLDQRHANLPKPPSDQNAYTLGSVGKHNVVIACLPKGKVGTTPAATVAAWMISTFPSIKFGLMVGIGGGIPPKVRLGDVVVSTPTGQFPGVVQWDSGKSGSGGFERTGALDNPPTSLLTALTKLETEHELNGSKIPEYLDELKTKWPRLAAKYMKSDSLEDVLFRADYSHVSETTAVCEVAEDIDDADEKEESCRLCDRKEVVKRKPRDMRVHYGLIASGNQVIKDAAFRDKLNRDLGGNVLCVEMEAAGLMNNFPCIVIRGICDYADSHKNKDWQEHAAAMAAAFTKELLEHSQPSDVDGERTVKDVLGKVEVNVAKIKSKLDRDEEIRILNWLTQVDYGPQQTDFINRRQKDTGQWLLDSAEYQAWLQAGKQTLFCPGIPGVGKTIFTSIVIDDLTTRFHDNPDIGIAYIYCNFRRWDEQKAGDLLASLLKQLSQGRSSLPAHVKALYEKHKDKRTRPSFDEISGALHWVSAMYSKVIIIVDALDECQPSDGCQLLSHIFSLQADNAVSFFATSRPIPDIEGYFKECLRLEIIASDEDVRRYVHGHMSHLPKFVCNRPDIQEEIEAEIAGAVEGMFLLAQLYLDSLKDKTSVTEMKSALKKFRKQSQQGPGEDGKRDVLEQAYDQAVERIDSQMTGFRLLGRKTLSWICCAKRPLTTYELQHALAVKTGDTELDKDNLRGIEDVVSVCAGLVTVDEESNILRLVHHTAQKYFERAQKVWLQDAETEITTACVTYLSFNTFERGPCVTDEEFEQRLQQNSLYGYAARNWGHHARRASPLVHELILGFVESEAKVSASSQAMLASKLFGGDSGYAQRVPKQITCVHLAASFGLLETMIYLQSRHSLDVRDSRGRTPLSLAAENGHEAVVDLLLEKDVDLETKDNDDPTPLCLAINNRDEAVVKLLLKKDINLEVKDHNGYTPLLQAVMKGHEVVVKLLLKKGVDLEVQDSDGCTALWWAVENRNEAVVMLLLENGVNLEVKDSNGNTPLLRAVRNGGEAVVKLLLENGADMEAKDDDFGFTPLFWAIDQRYETVVKLLLERGADVEAKDDAFGFTPLLWVVSNGDEMLTKLLLENGANLEPKDNNGLTPLSLAALRGDEGVIKLLLEKDVDLEAKDNHGLTPLFLAVHSNNAGVVKILLEKGVNLEVKDSNGYTALGWALEKGYAEVVKLLQTELQ
ncbi:ankyrin repeat protein [Ilyonectria robusta]|uniref:ankyrin repeat protein n=1 Tax=Ilyonectria robusta TaxID=1079257 RepID=UPI001E8D0944|nr:ankyrin repeat protein [Ilyonectria robusta]KAH8665584.1 ankyrin repeat protein [Ilyonectria robusta]